MIEDEMENIQKGKFYISSYSIHWSLDLLSETITVGITDRPDLGIKVIDKKNTVAEFRVDKPQYKRFYTKLSADFNIKQLSVSGSAMYLIPHSRFRTRTYKDVIILSW